MINTNTRTRFQKVSSMSAKKHQPSSSLSSKICIKRVRTRFLDLRGDAFGNRENQWSSNMERHVNKISEHSSFSKKFVWFCFLVLGLDGGISDTYGATSFKARHRCPSFRHVDRQGKRKGASVINIELTFKQKCRIKHTCGKNRHC